MTIEVHFLHFKEGGQKMEIINSDYQVVDEVGASDWVCLLGCGLGCAAFYEAGGLFYLSVAVVL